jgi:hypothetical protein
MNILQDCSVRKGAKSAKVRGDKAKLLTYLKLSNHRLGFLVNWNVILIKDGIKRMVNRL